MFSWSDIPSVTSSRRCHAAILRKMSYDNYGFKSGQWNLTDIIKSSDQRSAYCLMILDGKLSNGEKHESINITGPDGNPILYKLSVLSRYACKHDKDGNRLFTNEDGLKRSGGEDDKLIQPGEKPVPGDKVDFKMGFKVMHEDGTELRSMDIMSMSEDGRDIYDRRVFTVDNDLCISLPNPYALMALRRNGYKILFPEFALQYRPRKVTNWWYKEVPRDYHIEKPQAPDATAKGKK
jgi:hypothetical protein